MPRSDLFDNIKIHNKLYMILIKNSRDLKCFLMSLITASTLILKEGVCQKTSYDKKASSSKTAFIYKMQKTANRFKFYTYFFKFIKITFYYLHIYTQNSATTFLLSS